MPGSGGLGRPRIGVTCVCAERKPPATGPALSPKEKEAEAKPELRRLCAGRVRAEREEGSGPRERPRRPPDPRPRALPTPAWPLPQRPPSDPSAQPLQKDVCAEGAWRARCHSRPLSQSTGAPLPGEGARRARPRRHRGCEAASLARLSPPGSLAR